jgi:prophage regulatory protein
MADDMHRNGIIGDATYHKITVRHETIWRLPKVMSETGRSKGAIYKDKSFPKPIKLSTRAVGWLSEEVQYWLAERIKASRCE